MRELAHATTLLTFLDMTYKQNTAKGEVFAIAPLTCPLLDICCIIAKCFVCNCPAEQNAIHCLKLFLDCSCFQKIEIVVEMCFFTQDGVTALMCATANGKCDVFTDLISLGVDVDIQNNVSYIIFMTHCQRKVKDLPLITYYTQSTMKKAQTLW